MKCWRASSLLALALVFFSVGTMPAEAGLSSGKTVKADINGDGCFETVKLRPRNGGLEAVLYDRNFNVLGRSIENDFDKYSTCFIADIDKDGSSELLFSSGPSDPKGGRTAVLRWKNGKFTPATDYKILRSANDTTEFLWIEPEQITNNNNKIELFKDFYANDAKVNVFVTKLRRVGVEIWGDLTISGEVYGQLKFLPKSRCLKAVEARGYCEATKSRIALPFPNNDKIKVDLTGDGNSETVSFNSYYPGTGEGQHYQIVVRDSAGNILWKSPRAKSNCNRELALGEGGIGLGFFNGNNSLSSGIIADIDCDGNKELLVSTWERGYDRIEIWRWINGKFKFVRKAHLVRSAEDAQKYIFVDVGNNLDNNNKVYSHPNNGSHISLSNIRFINGELWGIAGVSGCGANSEMVKLKPCPDGMKVLKSKPKDSIYW